MTTRRDFLRGAIALAGGLVVGEEALEMFARLTHVRKTFPSAAIMGNTVITDAELNELLKDVYREFQEKTANIVEPLLKQYNIGKHSTWGVRGMYFDVVRRS